jgi:hypothetical protein
LVRRRTPAAVDDELGTVGCGIGCGPAQGAKEGWIEVDDTRNRIVEDRRAVGHGAVSLAKRTPVLTATAVNG